MNQQPPQITRRHRPSANGFTLAETMLVVIIGAIVLGSGTVMFRQLRESAGYSVAQSRVQAARTLIERVLTQQATLPTAEAFDELLLSNRHEDRTNSPWGGPSDCGPIGAAPNPINSSCYPETGNESGFSFRYIPLRGSNRFLASSLNHGDSGLLYYIAVTQQPTATRPVVKEIMVFDHATKLYTRTEGYALAYCDNRGRRYLFPSGPPVYTASGLVAEATDSTSFVGGAGSSTGGGGGGTSGGGLGGRVGGVGNID